MPTPRQGYFLEDGTKVPSVTTILSRFKEAGGLLYWAANEEKKHAIEILKGLKKDTKKKGAKPDEVIGAALKEYAKEELYYNVVRDSACDVGNVVHDLAEKFILGEPIPRDSKALRLLYPKLTDEEAKRAGLGFKAFKKWAEGTSLEAGDTEKQFVSEKYKYGGTPDAMLKNGHRATSAIKVDGKRAIGDWKTSGRIYPEYLVQLAAYGNLWNENNPDDPIVGGFYLLRFDKHYGDFHMHYWGELDAAWEAFKIMRQLYDLMAELKERTE